MGGMERVESPARDLCGNVMAITSPWRLHSRTLLMLRISCPPCPASTSPTEHAEVPPCSLFLRILCCQSQVAPVRSSLCSVCKEAGVTGAVRLSSRSRQHSTLRRRTSFTTSTALWQNPSQDQLRAGKLSFGYGFLGDQSSWQRRNGQAAYSWWWELVDETVHAMTHQEADGMPRTKVGINFRNLPVDQYFPQLGLTSSR